MGSRLSDLQRRVLLAVAGVEPPPVLTGGAALAGFYTLHRTTRDLDAFWRDRERLGELPDIVTGRLASLGFNVNVLQATPAFVRLRVSESGEVCLLDLVADPVASVDPPVSVSLAGQPVLVDTAHEILVNKLCTLVERAELRDLIDVKALVKAGGDLERALADAPRKDGGFSPLTLAWVLETTSFEEIAKDGGDETDVPALLRFRQELIDILTTRDG
jgi:hypothetical protein